MVACCIAVRGEERSDPCVRVILKNDVCKQNSVDIRDQDGDITGWITEGTVKEQTAS